MSLCFLRLMAHARSGAITQQEYLSHLMAHFRGVRHPEDEVPSVIEPLACFEPWAASLRDLALKSEYELLEDTSEYEALFMTCIEGRANNFKSDLRAIRKRSSQPDPLQPAACLAAQNQKTIILEACLKEGAVFDRYLTRAAQMGARGNIPFLELLLAWNWDDIRCSAESVQEQIEHFGEDSIEAKWLKEHAGKGGTGEDPGTSTEKRRGPKQPNNKSNRDPNQGFSPEQIQEWFGDVPW